MAAKPNIYQGKERDNLTQDCDTGFGHLLALRLNKMRFFVIASVLDTESDGAKALKANACNSSLLRIIKVDVTKDDDFIAAKKFVDEALTKHHFQLHAVVNNAENVNVNSKVELYSRIISFGNKTYIERFNCAILVINECLPVRNCRALAAFASHYQENMQAFAVGTTSQQSDTESDGVKALKASASNSSLLRIIKVDVTKDDDFIAAKKFVEKILIEQNLELHAVVNNAGIALSYLTEWYPNATVKNVEISTIIILNILVRLKGKLINFQKLYHLHIRNNNDTIKALKSNNFFFKKKNLEQSNNINKIFFQNKLEKNLFKKNFFKTVG
ncbi:11-beta-hydroxysteroid dehydrogenase type 2 [Pseudolycoriella hygida]|uniref:11-beta-hydroxysteroid dehydrogenase type 2 n=1 Tax=Pseudolycoriella hygida TaxID=35572 RepID=A0A9Q0S2G3_9DIPT|nr:11-beta-hydroxysteroid dehydrogenase type 2 [Pseudolycoriella hygida]